MKRVVPVIDIFAGPGGLSEGFSSIKDVEGHSVFDVCLSIEKEEFAHKTLLLRSFFRELLQAKDLEGLADYYSMLRGSLAPDELFVTHPEAYKQAEKTAWKAELGSAETSGEQVNKRIKAALGRKKRFVLIGGPPCQAYSLAGRSRNKGNKHYDPRLDKRQVLYKEYLQILADHSPVLFVMENVKGLLSAKLDKNSVLDMILNDLHNPSLAVYPDKQGKDNKRFEYRLYSFVEDPQRSMLHAKDFIIKSENHGIPQSRHRLIILGVRGDYEHVKPGYLETQNPVAIEDVINDLPKLRSGLSKAGDSMQAWLESLEAVLEEPWYLKLQEDEPEIFARISAAIQELGAACLDRGGEFVPQKNNEVQYLRDWYQDECWGGVCNHATRSHIVSDLHRYLYASCYAMVKGKSPDIKEYPKQLLPLHRNLRLLMDDSLEQPVFADRFRVQLADRPSTTITSHISKDGHYYIHPDPLQCRSLTVREAARLQTFPDNYFFCGPRTAQYHQVGNAVPPYLAYQLAEIVRDMLRQMRIL